MAILEPMKALCNTCMRVKLFPSWDEAVNADCQCGATGEQSDGFCPCPGCQKTAEDLERGGRHSESVSGLMPGCKFDSWTAEGGTD